MEGRGGLLKEPENTLLAFLNILLVFDEKGGSRWSGDTPYLDFLKIGGFKVDCSCCVGRLDAGSTHTDSYFNK